MKVKLLPNDIVFLTIHRENRFDTVITTVKTVRKGEFVVQEGESLNGMATITATSFSEETGEYHYSYNRTYDKYSELFRIAKIEVLHNKEFSFLFGDVREILKTNQFLVEE